MCTYKRPDLISALLSDIIYASLNATNDWELVVVDNAGDKETKSYCDEAANSSINLKYVYENRAGVSAARNRAVAESNGDWLLFLDDDVSFDDDFIFEMLRAISSHDVDIICPRMITPVQPDWPNWLRLRLASGVGQFDLGSKSLSLDSKTKIPVGACVCVRRRVYDLHGPFKENLDRIGKKPFGGGETLLLWYAFQAGAKGVYLPHFTIRHEFISGKKTKSYWRWQGFYGGRSTVRMQEYRDPQGQTTLHLLGLAASGLSSP